MAKLRLEETVQWKLVPRRPTHGTPTPVVAPQIGTLLSAIKTASAGCTGPVGPDIDTAVGPSEFKQSTDSVAPDARSWLGTIESRDSIARCWQCGVRWAKVRLRGG